ncbi:MAG: histidinol-phosphatase HisJ family protein [Oscillospiraceae bacterium]|nr:histidinol-phosphatase HisJ family protein [Oscillospiraceae bacterium]
MDKEQMTNIIPVDCHIHSTLSPDGNDSPETMARRAFELGIKHFTLTDHIENEKLSSWGYAEAMEKSLEVYRRLKAEYEGRMNVYFGAELGQALYDLPQAEAILERYDYDFVLGSQHRTKSYARVDRLPDDDTVKYAYLDEYFEELLALAEWGRFCSLSHLTFPLRFISGDVGGGELDITRYCSVIDKILDTIIKKDIALEVNSSGIRKGLHVPMPGMEYVKRYRDRGGRMITVGSDAHRAEDVGADIPQCLEGLREIGFSEICVFSKKQPIFIKI